MAMTSLPPMLSTEQLGAFGTDGYLVVPGFVAEPLLAELAAEADSVMASEPAPQGEVGCHHHFTDPASLPVADRVLRESGVLSLAGELVAPLTIDHAFDHIQIATSIHGWDHEPGGGHIDGYGIEGQTKPLGNKAGDDNKQESDFTVFEALAGHAAGSQAVRWGQPSQQEERDAGKQ